MRNVCSFIFITEGYIKSMRARERTWWLWKERKRLYWIENSLNKRRGNGETDSEPTHIPSNLISCLISGSRGTMPQLGQWLNPPSRHGSTLIASRIPYIYTYLYTYIHLYTTSYPCLLYNRKSMCWNTVIYLTNVPIYRRVNIGICIRVYICVYGCVYIGER